MAGIASMVDLTFSACSLSSLYYLAVCSHRDLILYTIAVGKIAAVQAPCYIYRRQNYKHNSNFIPKTFANLIEPKMWPLCMARNGGPTVDVGPSIARPTVDARPTTVGPGHPQSAWVASWPRTDATAFCHGCTTSTHWVPTSALRSSLHEGRIRWPSDLTIACNTCWQATFEHFSAASAGGRPPRGGISAF